MIDDRFRGFIAAPLPEGALESLVRAQEKLQGVAATYRADLRWSRPEMMHVTLKFLGSISRDHIASLAAAVARHAGEVGPIDATLTTIGVFGPPRRARVLHVAILDPERGLSRLAEAFASDAELIGVAREDRAFTPHITLARWRRPGNAKPLLEAHAFRSIPVRFEVVRLYESRPGPQGSRYTVLCEAALAAP